MWKIVKMTSPRPVSATVILAPTLESKNAHTNGTACRSAFGVGGPFGWRIGVEEDIGACVSRMFGGRLCAILALRPEPATCEEKKISPHDKRRQRHDQRKAEIEFNSIGLLSESCLFLRLSCGWSLLFLTAGGATAAPCRPCRRWRRT